MDFQTLKSTIDQQISGNLFIMLATAYNSNPIMDLAQRFFPDGRFTLDRAARTIDESNQSVEVTGYLKEKLFKQLNLKVTITFSIANGQAQLRAACSEFPVNWKISDLFPQTQATIANDFHYLNPTLILDSQVPDKLDENFQTAFDFPADKPTTGLELKQGLSFKAQIVRADIPKRLQFMLADSTQPYLNVSGPILIKYGKVMFQWRTDPVQFNLGSTHVPLELQLVMVSPKHIASGMGWTNSRVFALIKSSFTLTIPEQGPVGIPAYAVINSKSVDTLTVLGKAAPNTNLPVKALASYMAGTSITDTIPSDFPVINDILLEEFGFRINLRNKTLSKIFFNVELDNKWSLYENWLNIEKIKLLFQINLPLTNPNLNVIGNATLEIGNVDLELLLFVNALDFRASLQEGQTIGLTQMANSLMGLPVGLPEVKGTSFYIEGNITQKYFVFSTTLESAWSLDIGNKKFSFRKLRLELEYQGQTESTPRSIGGSIYGELAIAGATLYLAARKSNLGWEFSGGTYGDTTIALTACVSELATLFGTTLPASVPKINLKNLSLFFDTGASNYQFIGEIDGQGSIPLANNTFNLKTRINLTSSLDEKTNTRTLTGHVEAFLDVGPAEWQLRYEMGNDVNKVTASWRAISDESITLDNILDTLGIGDRIDIPNDLDLNMVQIQLEYDHKNSFATLSARTKSHGDAFMTVGRQDGKWGFVFGINITPTDGKASKLPAVGQYLQAADFIELKQAGIIISTSKIRNYQIPPLPLMMDTTADPDSALGNRPAQPVAASTQLQLERGFTTVAVINLETQGTQGKTMATALPDPAIPFQLSYSSSGISFYTGLSGTLPIPSASNKLFSISNAGFRLSRTVTQVMTFSIMGGFSFKLFNQPLDVMLSLNLETTGASASLNIETGPNGLPGPPGLKGFHFIQAGLLLGMTYQPPAVEMVLQGKFKIGTLQNNADQFGIGMKFVQTPAWPTPVPVLSYLSFYIEQAGFDQLVTLVTDKPADGATGVLSNVRGYDLSFYYCDEQTLLPDGTIALPGIGFSGQIKFFGFGAYGAFNMKVDKGIDGHAEIAPINLGNVLKVTGGGKGLKRTYEKLPSGDWKLVKNNAKPKPGTRTISRTIVQPGGAILQFNALKSPFLYMNWKISLFDLINQEVEAEITTKGITFHLMYAISNTLQFQITCTLSNWSSLAASASLSINLDMTIPGFKVNGVVIGDIKLKSKVSITLSLSLSTSQFHLGLAGTFTFQKKGFSINVNLNVAPSDLKNIPKWIKDEIIEQAEELFADLFDEVDEFVNMVKDGILDTGGKTLDGLSKAYNLTADQFADTAKKLGHTTEEVGRYMKDGLGYTAEAVSSSLQKAGYETKEVWEFMQRHFNWFSHVDIKHTDLRSESFHGDISKRIHADRRQHFDLKIAGKTIHADVGKTFGVNKRVGLTPHVDVKHTDLKPSYEKQHIDVRGISIPKNRYGGQTLINERINLGVGTHFKIMKFNKHLDLGHLDEGLHITVPRAPAKHVDVGHVDVRSTLPKP